LSHDYKFKTIIMLKDVWISKSKSLYVFLFFECFEHMDPFLWSILKFTKKLKWFNEHLIRKKNFWNKKTTWPHVFFECFKYIKRFLKLGEFHENFVVTTLKVETFMWKIQRIFWYIAFPWWFFKNLKLVFKDYSHILWFFISCFHPFDNVFLLTLFWQFLKSKVFIFSMW